MDQHAFIITSSNSAYHARFNRLLIEKQILIHTTNLSLLGNITKRLTISLVFLDNQLLDEEKIGDCQILRNIYDGFIIVFSDRQNDTFQEEEVLNMGIDGFLDIRHSDSVLRANINSLIRRINQEKVRYNTPIICIQDLTIHCHKHQVFKNDEIILLTYGEFELLLILVQRAGKLVDRDRIMEHIPSLYNYRESRALDLRISALRKKLGDNQIPHQYIKTIRGKGYIFIPD